MSSTSRLRHWSRVVEAGSLLAVGTVLQRWVPITWWVGMLGHAHEVPQGWSRGPVELLPTRPATPIERRVKVAVIRGSYRLPWEPSCLAEAFATQVMLRRRHEPGLVVIGLRPPDEGATGPWPTHAWLLGREGALSGGPAARGYTPVTVYSCDVEWNGARGSAHASG